MVGPYAIRQSVAGCFFGVLWWVVGRRSVPFVVLVLIALLLAVISIEPATMLFILFVGYGLSGYVIYAWRRARGEQVSIVSTSTDEPDERGLHD